MARSSGGSRQSAGQVRQCKPDRGRTGTMTIIRSRIGAATILALSTIGLIAACQPTKQVTGSGVAPVGGFIPNPSLLKPGGSGQLGLAYINPDVNLASYNKMILDPVTVMAGTGSSLEK